MHRCRPRALNAAQYHVLTYALLGEDEKPWRNSYTAEANDCAVAEQLVRTGLLRLENDKVPGFRNYRVTQRGADVVGLWLPYD